MHMKSIEIKNPIFWLNLAGHRTTRDAVGLSLGQLRGTVVRRNKDRKSTVLSPLSSTQLRSTGQIWNCGKAHSSGSRSIAGQLPYFFVNICEHGFLKFNLDLTLPNTPRHMLSNSQHGTAVEAYTNHTQSFKRNNWFPRPCVGPMWASVIHHGGRYVVKASTSGRQRFEEKTQQIHSNKYGFRMFQVCMAPTLQTWSAFELYIIGS